MTTEAASVPPVRISTAAAPDEPLEDAIRRKELELKERELDHRIRMEVRGSRLQIPPLTLAVVGGVLSLLATAVGAAANGIITAIGEKARAEREQEMKRLDQQFEIVMRATADRSPEEAAQNLLFFVEVGYLADDDSLIRRKATAGDVPVITTGGASAPGNPLTERIAETPRIAPPTGGAAFAIQNHVLYGRDGSAVPAVATPSLSALVEPRFILLHYTADQSVESAAAWLAQADARASAHLIVQRDGAVIQMAPFDRATFHAGRSEWNGVSGLNRYSIGISLVNAGRLRRTGDGWVDAMNQPVPAAEVEEVRDPATGDVAAWHRFSDEQVATTVALGTVLRGAYASIEDVLGHAQVSPGRKLDPGPLFPLERTRARIMGAGR